MNSDRVTLASAARLSGLFLALLFIIAACRALPTGVVPAGPDASPEAEPTPSPTPITKTMCESAADLGVDVAFLGSLELHEDGLVSVLVAVDAALGEARTLATLVAEEYRPFAVDLVLSLETLRVTVDQIEQSETAGEGIAAVGEAIVGIGESMDTLELELREPCPESD